jgi:hypothetical protein
MWGNVDSPLNLQSGDTEVDAHGWMEWAPHEESAVFTVVITQGTVSGTGSKTYPKTDTRWQIPVKAGQGKKFQRDQAMASVTAVVRYDNGSTATVTWSTPVQLH